MSRSPDKSMNSDDNRSKETDQQQQQQQQNDHEPPSEDLASMLALSAKSAPAGWSTQHPHLFHLASFAPSAFDGGSLAGANEENWSVLKGQQASVYIARLEPGAVREPHWHPFAWELNFVISGRVKWSLLGPKAAHDCFEAGKGDLVFVPPGHFHYFENASESEDLVVFIVFNTSTTEPADDIGIVASLSVIPPDVLGAVFRTSPDAFRNLPHKVDTITIARKQRQ